MLRTAKSWKAPLVMAALGGFLLLGGFAPAQAHDRDDKCIRRIHKAEEKLERDVRRHGVYSRQAEKRRRELDRARESCGFYRYRDYDYHYDRYLP